MPAPRITTLLPVPLFGGSGCRANASGTLIRPRAVIVSYTAAAPPARPTASRNLRRVHLPSDESLMSEERRERGESLPALVRCRLRYFLPWWSLRHR